MAVKRRTEHSRPSFYRKLSLFEQTLHVGEAALSTGQSLTRNETTPEQSLSKVDSVNIIEVKPEDLKQQEQNANPSATASTKFDTVIIRALQDAKVAVLKSDQQLLFLKLKSFENLRRNWRDVSNEELVQKIKEREIKTSFLPEILKSCELEELPTLSNRADLERRLKTKFHNYEETVTPVTHKLL